MDISLLSVSRAPCVPFSSRPQRRTGQYHRSKQLVRCAAQQKEEGQKADEFARNLGKVCAPFAAAVLLLAQSQPAFAETPYEQSMRIQKEFQSSGSRLDSFLNKGTRTSDVISDSGNVKAAIDGGFGNPVETAKDAVKEAAPSKKGLLGLFDKASTPKAGEVKGAVGDATDAVKGALPDAGDAGKAADKAKAAAGKVADAAPSKGGGFFGGFFGGGSKTEDVKGAVSDAASSAKDALPDPVKPSQVASGAKEAADKASDAAPSPGGFFQGLLNDAPDAGDVKGAVGDAASSAKDALPDSANPSQVASGAKDAADKVADAAPNDLVSGAKSAAKSVADAAPSSPGDAVDSAKQGLKDASLTSDSPREALASAKDAADSAKDAAKDTAKDVVGSAQDEAEVVGSGNKAPSGAGFFSQFLGDAKSTAEDVKGSAQSAAGDAKDALPTGGQVKDAVQEAAPDNKSGGGIFGNLLSGGPTPQAPQPVSNQLEAPQPSSLEEEVPKGAEKLPPQPYPEKESAVPADRSGADSSGSKFGETVEDTTSGGGILDSFGGGPSGKSQEQKKDDLVEQSKKPNPNANFLGDLFGGEGNPFKDVLGGSSAAPTNEVGSLSALPAPQPSDVDEKGNLPQKSPGDEIKLPEQPKPEGPAPEQLGKDSAGGKTGSTKSGGGILDFFGGSSSNPSQPTSDLQKPVSLKASVPSNLVATTAQVEAPQPSSLEEEFPESAPGKENTPEEQPAPEPASKQLPQDSAGGKTGSTKSGGGILDFFGGSSNNPSQPTSDLQKPVSLTADASSYTGASNEVASLAALPPPQPSDVEEQGNLPEKAPGDEIKLPEQPKPEGSAPEDLGKDSAGGKTGSTKSGGGILDFFGGSSSPTSQPNSDLQKPTSLTPNAPGFNLVANTAQVEAPQPSSLEEEFPESAPGKEITPEEQPAPEPASKQLPQDSAGGKTQDTKSGGGILDSFGGGTGKDSSQKAADNVNKASASVPRSSEIGQVAEGEEAAAVADADKPDGLKATLIGLAFSIALEITIFTVQPKPQGKKAAH